MTRNEDFSMRSNPSWAPSWSNRATYYTSAKDTPRAELCTQPCSPRSPSCWWWTAFAAGCELTNHHKTQVCVAKVCLQNCPYLQYPDFILTSEKNQTLNLTASSVLCLSLWHKGEGASKDLLKHHIKAKVLNQHVNRL